MLPQKASRNYEVNINLFLFTAEHIGRAANSRRDADAPISSATICTTMNNMNENELGGGMTRSAGEGAMQRSGYGLPPNEQAAAERFFAELRNNGRIRLARAKAGWTKKEMDGWKQPWNEDGSKNRRYRPAFAKAVEAAICHVQGRLIERVLGDDDEEGNSGRQRMAAWLLERLFRGEFVRAKESGRPEEGRKKQPPGR